jgi:hypothetical protein
MRSQAARPARLTSLPNGPGRGRTRAGRSGHSVSVRSSIRAPGAASVRFARAMISSADTAGPVAAAWLAGSAAPTLRAATL